MTHTLKGNAETRMVWLDGVLLDPGPSQKIRNHSPDGFNWGYDGSGPAQLALAILLKLNADTDDYQEFKIRIIARLPQGKDFETIFQI